MKVPIAFLSHASQDATVAERLARDLRSAAVEVWYDKWEMKPGDSLRRKIDEGIDAASYFLVLLTPASLQSEWVQTELDAGMVNRISGKCRLIPILLGVTKEQVPATLRGLIWVELEPYDEGLRRLIEACHEVSTKPPLGEPPAWARERPLEGSSLSPNAQRLAAWINEHSKDGTVYQIFERDLLMAELDLTAEEIGMAVSELDDDGYVKLVRDSGSGVAGFSFLEPRARLFFDFDPVLQGWDPERDARELAATLVNLARDGGVSMDAVDRHLGWGPRRLNPAADYLKEYGYVNASKSTGSAPYSYSHAIVSHRTRRFAQAAGI